MAGYYRRFIEEFSKITLSLTTRTKNVREFKWTNEYERSFQELKRRLIIPLVLTLPTLEKEFEVYYDT